MNMILRRTFFALNMVAFSHQAKAQGNSSSSDNRAPFGLFWGRSAAEIRALGVTLVPIGEETDFGIGYRAEGLRAVLSDAERIILFCGFKDRLWRIFATSRKIGPDPYGYAGLRRYQEIQALLSDRYGKGEEVDERGTYNSNPEMYVFYLRQGRVKRYTNFRGNGMDVQLGLRGEADDTMRWVLFYESIQESITFNNDRKLKEKESL
jgi:hypothetical protein